MRCRACNCNLNDFESTRKDEHGEYIDMCTSCYDDTVDDDLYEDSDFEPLDDDVDDIEFDDTPWFLKEQTI